MSSRAATGALGGWALRRSVTLLRVFLLSSAGILFIGATMLARQPAVFEPDEPFEVAATA